MNKRLEKVTRLTDQARADRNANKVLQGEYLKYQIREKEQSKFNEHLNRLQNAN
jgi:hypothetical protein